MLLSTLRLASPYLFASLGETISQRAGVLNLGLEGIMLMGAYAAFWGAWQTGHAAAGVVAAVLAGLLAGLVMAVVSVSWKAEQGLSGIGLYLLGMGGTSLLFQVQVGQVQQVIVFPELVWLAYLLVPVTWWLLERTRFGLEVKAVGENPEAAEACGLSVTRVRYQAVALGSVLAALGGASLSLGILGFFQERVTNGIGFIAVALVYFGGWRPIGVLFGSLLFSLVNTFQLFAQTHGWKLNTELALMLPYLLTLGALALPQQRRAEPSALGRAFGPAHRTRHPRLLAALAILAGLVVFGPQQRHLTQSGPPSARIAVILPGIKNDLSWGQSLSAALERLKARTPGLEVAYSESQFNVTDAAASIRDYAARGFDLVICHGTQYSNAMMDIARDFPDVSFAYGTATSTGGRANVFAYNAEANQGGYLQGIVAARLTRSKVIGVVGPIEAGDADLYIDGFKAGVAATDPAVRVNVSFTGSFSDTALAAEAAQVHLQAGADVLTGTAQQVVGAVAVCRRSGVWWLGTQYDQATLAPELVVSCQVYEWSHVLEDILTLRRSGVRGGKAYDLTLANGGLRLVYNPQVALPPRLSESVSAALEGIVEGKITP